MKFFYLFSFLFFFFQININAQKVLQIEKYGKAKTEKIHLGSDITFQLKGSKDWFTDVLIDVKPEENILVFSQMFVKVDEIQALKTFKGRRAAKTLQTSLYSFAMSWLFYSVAENVFFREPLRIDAVTVPLTSVALGWSIRKIFSSKKIKIGKRRRLRALDIGFNSQMQYDFND